MKNKKTLLYDDACPLCSWYSGAFVKSGIDALVAIIGQRCPIVRVLGKKEMIKWPLKKLYNFISYNRKAVHAIIVCSNCLLAFSLSRKEAIEYLGQVNMLALITILLLIPLMWLNNWWRPVGEFNWIYLFFLSIFIVKEYFRRMNYAGTCKHKTVVVVNLLSMAAFFASLFVL